MKDTDHINKKSKKSSFKRVVLVIFLVFIGIILFYSTVIFGDQPSSELSANIDVNKQLDDVNKKISQLPDLEKDVFSKCMEKSGKTALNIKNCQETTQKQIFTLAQELQNLKKNLEEKK